MPELPEVETVKNILEPLVKGKKIAEIDVYFPRLVLTPLSEFKSKLIGATITGLSRYGKFLFIHFDNSFVIISHLRMEGKYRFTKEYNPIRASSACFKFNDDTYLFYDDTRKFGIMYLTDEEHYLQEKMIAKLGPEANKIQDSDLPLLYKKFNKKKPMKALLLDQEILCGIGNIYADEILYATKINPLTLGNELSHSQIDEIAKNAKIILSRAIELGGSTIHSFHPSEGVDGKFQAVLMCYGKEGEICPNCGTTFHKIYVGGRGTTFCPNCQINKHYEKAIGITGPIGSGKSQVLNHLKDKGYLTISCDEEIHELYKDPIHKNKISRILKTDFDNDDERKRKIARLIMIEKPDKKKEVEKYIYPVLEEKLIKYITDNELVAIEVPLLFKAHFEFLFKKIFVLSLNKEKQVQNLENRGDSLEISLKLNSDYHYDKSNKKVILIENNRSLNDLFEQIDKNLN
jgi:formamidopyrimidine-DNA glycosylase